MGSINAFEKPKHGGRTLKKINASLDEKLQCVEWGEYKLCDLFEIERGVRLVKSNRINGNIPLATAGEQNQGIAEFISNAEMKIYENKLTIDMFCNCFYRNYKFMCDDNILVMFPKFNQNREVALYFAATISKDKYEYHYGRQYRQKTFAEHRIKLPTKNGKIDFKFIENFIAELEAERISELEAYLLVTGLKDTHLSLEEEQVLLDFEKIEWGEFAYKDIFDNIKQGRRLKKDDQIEGDIPFVMSGVTNNGVVGYISNPVASFPKNSITLDIFGNAFYRGYEFGAGDDTGVYWNEKTIYSKSTMLFFTSAMEKSVRGKFSYGKKLRSSQSLDIKMMLPMKDENVDLNTTDVIISAIQKLVIKDVVLYSDSKISATKKVVSGNK